MNVSRNRGRESQYSQSFSRNQSQVEPIDLSFFDTKIFAEEDPLINENTHIEFELELPLKVIYLQDNGEIDPLDDRELIKVRALKEMSGGQMSLFRVELTSEQYLFFMFVHMFDNQS